MFFLFPMKPASLGFHGGPNKHACGRKLCEADKRLVYIIAWPCMNQ